MPSKTAAVIILDGNSSAGKTTLLRCLQNVLAETCWHLPIDEFAAFLPDEGSRQRNAITEDSRMSAYHSCLAVIAAAGSNVIAGPGFLEEAWLSGCLEKLSPFRVLFVRVICPLEGLE